MKERRKDTTVRFRIAFITADVDGEMRVRGVEEFIKEAGGSGGSMQGEEAGACTRIWESLTKEMDDESVEVLPCGARDVKALMGLMGLIDARHTR